MEKLVQMKAIEKQLKVAPRNAISALYKLIFEEERNRGNRSKLREFSGFAFADDSPEFRGKIEYASAFSVGDLTSICNILGLDYSSSKEQLAQEIIRALMDINSLADTNSVNDTEDERDAEDDDENKQLTRGGRNDDENNEHELESDTNEDVLSFEHENRSESEETQHERQRTRPIINTRRSQPVHFSLGYKDVEDSIREFDGSDELSIERWLMDF